MAKAKIIAVDDNAVNLAAVERALQDEYDVLPMIAGARAIKYLKQKKVDLVLLDVQMPEMDGIQTLEEIRKLENGEKVAVMFLTAAKDENVAAQGERLGVVDYITKPFDEEDLKQRIRQNIPQTDGEAL